MRTQAVYLAGGFKSGWQANVIEKLHGFQFLDPSKHCLLSVAEYTKWDLDAVAASDIVFAYMEDSNPGGYALGLEIGYARALGKRIVFVNTMTDERRIGYFAMVLACCDFVTSSVDEAASYCYSLLHETRP